MLYFGHHSPSLPYYFKRYTHIDKYGTVTYRVVWFAPVVLLRAPRQSVKHVKGLRFGLFNPTASKFASSASMQLRP